MKKRRVALIIILILLLLLLFGLIYLYLALLKQTRIGVPEKIEGINHILSIYGYGKEESKLFNSPLGVACDREKKIIYVADSQNARILMFKPDGKFAGKLEGFFEKPVGIDFGNYSGKLYVSDTKRDNIYIFDSNLELMGGIRINDPLAVYEAEERLYVATFDSIHLFDEEYNLIEKWGKRGKEPAQFDFPHGIGEIDGLIIISDGNNMRLQALDKKGDVVWIFGKPPRDMADTDREFGLPNGLTVDDKNLIYVVDTLRCTIQVFNDKGKRLAELSDVGAQDGLFNFPSDIDYLGKGQFVVSDTYNQRIQIIEIIAAR